MENLTNQVALLNSKLEAHELRTAQQVRQQDQLAQTATYQEQMRVDL